MSALLRQRSRIARVRHIQHDLAAAAAAEAHAKVHALVENSSQLARIREGLVPQVGATNGAGVGSIGELATRLENARAGLELSLQRARELAEARENLRLVARRTQESADKLKERARKAKVEAEERLLTGTSRGRRSTSIEGEQG